jgi:hypothetical protein
MSMAFRSNHRTLAESEEHDGARISGGWRSGIHPGRRIEYKTRTSQEARAAMPKEVCHGIDLFDISIGREIDRLAWDSLTVVSAAIEVDLGMFCHIVWDVDLVFIATTGA